MKPLLRSFAIFVRQIARDNMHWAVCLAPLLTAFFFRFGIPYTETLLCAYFQRKKILADYFLLFDMWLCLTPSYMFCFSSAMVMLTGKDENMAGYMAVTPVGKKRLCAFKTGIPSRHILFLLVFVHIFFLTYPLGFTNTFGSFSANESFKHSCCAFYFFFFPQQSRRYGDG